MPPWAARLVTDDRTAWKRAAALLFALAVYLGAERGSGIVRGWLWPFVTARPEAQQVFWRHLLTNCLPTGVACALGVALLVRVGALRWPPLLGERPARGLLWATVAAVVLSGLTVALWRASGGPLAVRVDLWRMAGNVFSNFYEEVMFRVFLFGAALFTVRRPLVAALLSGVIFGVVHTQFPVPFRVYTGLVGMLICWIYGRAGLVGAWWVHQLADMILDTVIPN